MISGSVRLVDKLAQEGVIEKIRLPGRVRAAGFREADILALIEGRQAKRSSIGEAGAKVAA